MKNNISKLKNKLILTFGYGNRKNYDVFLEYLTGLTHKTKETGFLAGDFADEIKISRSETRFLRKSCLNKYQVNFVIDVRMTPRAWSRKWYGNKLQEVCEAHNVKYISKTALGNTSGQQKWIPPDREAADIALGEVAELAEQGTVLLLCAEMNFNRCHRTDVASHLIKLISDSQIEHLE
ncbi:MAG TPA: DUF488 domain-containing protein [Candidatus Obscuribacterales bacterium]